MCYVGFKPKKIIFRFFKPSSFSRLEPTYYVGTVVYELDTEVLSSLKSDSKYQIHPVDQEAKNLCYPTYNLRLLLQGRYSVQIIIFFNKIFFECNKEPNRVENLWDLNKFFIVGYINRVIFIFICIFVTSMLQGERTEKQETIRRLLASQNR